MIKLVDLTYYTHTEYTQPAQVLQRHKEPLGYIAFIKNLLQVQVVKHLNYEGVENIEGVQYAFFKSSNSFLKIPFKTHRYIKQQQPGVVLVQGFVFPLQVIALRLKLGRRVKIIIQHHGEKPFTGVKKLFQKIACRCAGAFMFTALDNAMPFIKEGLIAKEQCFQVLEASTFITPQPKQNSKRLLGITGEYNFLWVGRLEQNKDPVTILQGFEKYLQHNSSAKLCMIYQEDDLLPQVKQMIGASTLLTASVKLMGKVEHSLLANWYSAADFYIAGSHKEGSGYALIEAMACGCIPVVTNIPSFRVITANGTLGLLYERGNSNALLHGLQQTENVNREELSRLIIQHFEQHLSFNGIANDVYTVCKTLVKPPLN